MRTLQTLLIPPLFLLASLPIIPLFESSFFLLPSDHILCRLNSIQRAETVTWPWAVDCVVPSCLSSLSFLLPPRYRRPRWWGFDAGKLLWASSGKPPPLSVSFTNNLMLQHSTTTTTTGANPAICSARHSKGAYILLSSNYSGTTRFASSGCC